MRTRSQVHDSPFFTILGRSVSEIVRIYGALCVPGRPVDCPAPGSNPAEIAEKLIAAFVGLDTVTGKIKQEKLVCKITKDFPLKRAVCQYQTRVITGDNVSRAACEPVTVDPKKKKTQGGSWL